MSLSGTDAVILCGGLGTRLRPVLENRQKTMIEFNGKPFLEILMDWAAGYGCNRFVLCTGYQSSQVRSYFEKRSDGRDIAFSHEESPLGTGGALKRCETLLRGERVLVLNGDSYCPADLVALSDFHGRCGAVATVAVVEPGEREDGGFLEISENRSIVSFAEKEPRRDRALNAGIYMLERRVMDAIDPGKPVSLEKDVFPNLLKDGVYAFPCREPLYDIGTPERLEAFRLHHGHERKA